LGRCGERAVRSEVPREQPQIGNDVSEGATEIDFRVIVITYRFVTMIKHSRNASSDFVRRGVETGAVVILTIMLICAVLASLGVGVLVAYGVCIGMFGVFRMHARQVAAEKMAGRVGAPAHVAKS
jgi:hypothetical protein